LWAVDCDAESVGLGWGVREEEVWVVGVVGGGGHSVGPGEGGVLVLGGDYGNGNWGMIIARVSKLDGGNWARKMMLG